MAEASPYQILPVESDSVSLQSYVDLFVASFGVTDITPEFLDWQYNQNPCGRVVGYNAFFDGELAAHYVTIPMQARLAGVLATGLLSINTATHPRHQRQGLFPRLAEMTYQRGCELGHEFVVGVANQNSVYGFTRKLGFQSVGPLDSRLVSILRTREPPGPLDYVGEWTAEAVRWRLSNPKGRYSVRKLGAVAQIFGRSRRFPALVGQVPEDRIPPGAEAARFEAFKLWLGMDSRIDPYRSFQLSVPHRLRPVPLTLIFRDLCQTRQIDPRSTAFWAMDFDAY